MRDFAEERGFKCILAESGETGLHYADYYRPERDHSRYRPAGHRRLGGYGDDSRKIRGCGIFLCISCPPPTGPWTPCAMGAVGFLAKPVTIEKVEEAFARIKNFIIETGQQAAGGGGRQGPGGIDQDTWWATAMWSPPWSATGREALAELQSGEYDCHDPRPGPDRYDRFRASGEDPRMSKCCATGAGHRLYRP